MLVGLRVQGFKSLKDVSISFGPLTGFVGMNGVGKSNIFDAIQLLRHLADSELHKAASSVRRSAVGGGSALDLFWHRDTSGVIRIAADLLLPPATIDTFGELSRPTSRLVTYELALGWSAERHRLELRKESLRRIRLSDVASVLGFQHSNTFRDSIKPASKSRSSDYISTPEPGRIALHADGGSRGRPINPGPSPRTVLGGTTTKDYPTVLAAKQEMASWRQLQLEPSSLRAPDTIGEEPHMDEYGRHMAATVARLTQAAGDPSAVLVELANRAKRLVPTLREIKLEKDEGTLRFLALTIMQFDVESLGVLCIEEPENGMHPDRLGEMVEILADYAVDPTIEVDAEDNPLRQVILNTHSPRLTELIRAENLLFVDSYRVDGSHATEVASVDAESQWRNNGRRVSIQRLERLMGAAPHAQRQFEVDSTAADEEWDLRRSPR